MGGGGGRFGGGSMRSMTSGPSTRERSSFKHLAHIKRLFPYVARYKWVLIACISAMLVQRLLFNVMPMLTKMLYDGLAYEHIPADILTPVLGMLALVVLGFIIYVPSRRALRRISIAVTYDLRKRIFHHVQFQGPGFFNRYPTGDLMSRAVNDINMVRMAVSFGWVNIAMFVFTVATSLAFMIYLSPHLTLFVVLPLPIVAAVGFIMSRGMYPYYRERQEAMSAVTTFAQENLNGIRTIQAMAQEDFEIGRFREASTQYTKKYYRATRYMLFMSMAMSTLSFISPLIILGYGGSLVIAGDISVGTYLAFSIYLSMLTMTVGHIGHSLSMFVAAAAGTERIYEILDYETEVKDNPDFDLPGEVVGRLEFRNLRYKYPDAGTDAIHDFSIDIQPGETIALLGRVGSGKSTVLRAAVRLIDIPRETIFLDGHDICDYAIGDLRKLIGLVPQHAFLFSASLRENITYDDPFREDEFVYEAVEHAGLKSSIEEFKDGIETIVGERGITLSGGQKQRSTLARGLIRETCVLLLDDCFSSVDTETEERIISGLQETRAGKTTILISHRVSTARHADRIFVIDNGGILESGTHEELLSSGGYYADLEAIQSNQDADQTRRDSLLAKLEDEDARQATLEAELAGDTP